MSAADNTTRGVAVSAPSERTGVLRIASFPPPIAQNPFQRLLYDALASEGVVLVDSAPLRIAWLVDSRKDVDVLHFHWPEIYYRHRDATTVRNVLLSWIRVMLFAARLLTARALGYVVVWTIHQVAPHESPSPTLDRAGTAILARAAQVLVANDEATAAAAERRFGRRPAIVPHGSYIGVYPPGRSRDEVRAELGVGPGDVVFLSLGHLRRYKGLDLLLDAFGSTAATLPGARLVVAGMPLAGTESAAIAAAAAADERIVPLLGFVPDAEIAELFGAADAAVFARSDGGTSGALILALSHGVPVVAAELPAYVELLAGTEAGWVFAPGDRAGLAAALARAAAEPLETRRARGEAARARASELRWDDAAGALAALVRKAA
jgi:beta-1,4-mannosyltransferase